MRPPAHHGRLRRTPMLTRHEPTAGLSRGKQLRALIRARDDQGASNGAQPFASTALGSHLPATDDPAGGLTAGGAGGTYGRTGRRPSPAPTARATPRPLQETSQRPVSRTHGECAQSTARACQPGPAAFERPHHDAGARKPLCHDRRRTPGRRSKCSHARSQIRHVRHAVGADGIDQMLDHRTGIAAEFVEFTDHRRRHSSSAWVFASRTCPRRRRRWVPLCAPDWPRTHGR